MSFTQLRHDSTVLLTPHCQSAAVSLKTTKSAKFSFVDNSAVSLTPHGKNSSMSLTRHSHDSAVSPASSSHCIYLRASDHVSTYIRACVAVYPSSSGRSQYEYVCHWVLKLSAHGLVSTCTCMHTKSLPTIFFSSFSPVSAHP